MKATSFTINKTLFYGLETDGGAFLSLYYLKPIFEEQSIIAYQLRRTKNTHFSKSGPQHTTHFLLKGRVTPGEYSYLQGEDVLDRYNFNTTSSARRRIYFLAMKSIKEIAKSIDISGEFDVESASTTYEFSTLMEANKKLKEGKVLDTSLIKRLRDIGVSLPSDPNHPSYPKVGDYYAHSRYEGYLYGRNWTLMRIVSVDTTKQIATLARVGAELVNPEDRGEYEWEGVFKPEREVSGRDIREAEIFPEMSGFSLEVVGLGLKKGYFTPVKLNSKGQFKVRQKGWYDVSNEW